MTGVNLVVKKMIRKYGETVQHKKRVSNDEGNGEVYYSYTVEEPKRGQFMQLTATDEIFQKYGVVKSGDWIATFLPDTDVNKGDLLYVGDAWLEVQQVIERKTSASVDYVECLLRHKV